jgi:hypothetical protein
MAGYAATVRITHVAPRMVATHSGGENLAPELVVAIEPVEPAIEEVSGQPILAGLAYLWDDIREVWRQARDVMRDPQGWR